jgi:hypothetical protein
MARTCPRCGENIDHGKPNTKFCFGCSEAGAKKDQLRREARWAVNKAIRAGWLPSPKELKCVDCGRDARCYDHRDYYQPLRVDAVCKRCDARRGPGYPPIANKYNARPKTTLMSENEHIRLCISIATTFKSGRSIDYVAEMMETDSQDIEGCLRTVLQLQDKHPKCETLSDILTVYPRSEDLK